MYAVIFENETFVKTRAPQTRIGVGSYRMTGWDGLYDIRSYDKTRIIEETEKHKGEFVLWRWNGNQWKTIDKFSFPK